MNVPQTTVGPEGRGTGSPHGPAIDLQTILAPVDFSPASRHGLAFAGMLAARFHARLLILHVVEPPVLPQWGYAHIPQREAKLRHAAQERLPQLPAECGLHPELVVSAKIRKGEAEDEICAAAAEERSKATQRAKEIRDRAGLVDLGDGEAVCGRLVQADVVELRLGRGKKRDEGEATEGGRVAQHEGQRLRRCEESVHTS